MKTIKTFFNFRFEKFNQNEEFNNVANHLENCGWMYNREHKFVHGNVKKEVILSINDKVILEYLLFKVVDKIYIIESDTYEYELQFDTAVLENQEIDLSDITF